MNRGFKRKLWTAFLFVLVCYGILFALFRNSKKSTATLPPEFVFLLPSMPMSFDPLNFNTFTVSSTARMIYATPIEFTRYGELTSSILEYFKYDRTKMDIIFKLKENLVFGDGTPITISDLKFSLLRTIKFFPTLPVIRDIDGLDSWLLQTTPLLSSPRGFTIQDQTLKIHFTRRHRHPLVRFALMIFAVQPAACFDKKSGALRCAIPPESGPYALDRVIFHANPNDRLFELRKFRPRTKENEQMPQIMKVSFLDGPTFLRDSNKMRPEQRRVAEAFGLQLVSLLRAIDLDPNLVPRSELVFLRG